MQPQPDLSSLQAFLDASMSSDPLVVQPDDADTHGMSFADLFSHYLAPEVAKLPPSSSSSTAPLSGNGFTAAASELPSFDPSTFMPSTMPGSPFSPESDDQRSSTSSSGLNGGLHDRSPVSLADLDFSTAPVLSGSSEGFAIDPSVFEAPTFGYDADAILALPDLSSSSSSSSVPAPNASTSTAAAGPDLSQMTPAVLPPLPSLPVAPPAPVTASGRPKRSVVHSVIREQPEKEEEAADVARGGDDNDDNDDDENMYSSDASSSAAGRRNQPATRASRTRRPTKKARSASPSVSVSGTITGDEDQPSARKLARTSVVPLASATLHKTAANSHLPPVPMWADKPDPKEYAKLSSKEKRQLRNKISARNFRHRRKEYLTTLEDEISTRDTIISELQDEVGVIRAENTGLRTEVATLREQWQNLLDKLSSMTTPPTAATSTAAATGLGTNPPRVIASTSAAAVKQEEGAEIIMPEQNAATTSTRRVGTRSTSGIQVPNLSKDVAPLSRRSNSSNSKNNWGAAAGNFMSVHTTLVPDVPNFTNLADGLHGKPSLSVSAASSPFSNQSFNPAMNALTPSQLASLSAMTAHTRSGPAAAAAAAAASNDASSRTQQPNGTFQDLFASNPFYLRPDALDQSRAALYGKLANNAAGLLAAQKQAGEPTTQTDQQQSTRDERAYLPIPNGFRPAFFTSPKASSSSSTTASELLAFQSPSAAAAAAAASSIPSAPTLSHQEAVELRQQATMAQVAHLANQTLVQRLATSFWDAFVGPSPSGGDRSLDTDKVKAVLLGQARVQVVPNSTSPVLTPRSSLAEPSGLDALERRMSALEVGGAGSARSESPERCSFAQVGRRWLTGEKRV